MMSATFSRTLHWVVATALASALLVAVPASLSAQPLGFGPATPLAPNAASDSGHDQLPALATDANGIWIAVWRSGDPLGGTIGSDEDILLARSSDDGASWSAPSAIHSNAGGDSGADLNPAVASDGGSIWLVAWESDENLGGTIGADRDLLFVRSTNGGAAWSAPAPLNSGAGGDTGADEAVQLTTDGAGVWIAAWNSDENLGGAIGTDDDILFARSTDGGASWSAAAVLNTNAASDTGADLIPTLATDGAGNWVASWYSNDDLGGSAGGDYDLLVAHSSDHGATWSAPSLLNDTGTADLIADYDQHLASDGAGRWCVVWISSNDLGGTVGSDLDLFFAISTDVGATWSAAATLNTNAPTDSGNDIAPWVCAEPGGRWIVAWYSGDSLGGTIGTDFDIFVARSLDAGATTWSAPAALNSGAGGDGGNDYAPRLATDSDGAWVAVWYSNDSIGGTIGTDYDLLCSVSASVPLELSGIGID
jgi:hypothetical protein